MTASILVSDPADPSAAGSGPDRGTAPSLSGSVVTQVAGNFELSPEVRRYAERRTLEALRQFCGVRSVDILLGSSVAGETTCRLHVTFGDAPPIVVGHSGPAMLHTIDIAVETTAQIVASRRMEKERRHSPNDCCRAPSSR